MATSPSDIADVIRAGASVSVDADEISTPALVELARTARGHQRTLIIRHADGMSSGELADVARAGSGYVLFEFHSAEPGPTGG